MTKTVDLVSYLPPFMADFKEISVTLEAENPEFVLVWKAADRVLQNEFIESADEYGISRFEKILNILPSTEDTLESRRANIKAVWFSKLPYTIRTLANSIEQLCGNDFEIKRENGLYTIYIKTHLRERGRIKKLKEFLDSTIPANIIINLINSVKLTTDNMPKIYSGVGTVGIHKKRSVEVRNYGLERSGCYE